MWLRCDALRGWGDRLYFELYMSFEIEGLILFFLV